MKQKPTINWPGVFCTQHGQAFSAASALPERQLAGIFGAINAALKNGDGFAEFQKRLSKVLF